MSQYKVALVDPVGLKAGMNCYDLSLLRRLDRQPGVSALLFSNFDSEESFPVRNVFDFEKRGLAATLVRFVSGHLRAYAEARRQGARFAIYHIFSTSAKDYFAIMAARALGLKVVVIAHDVKSLAEDDVSLFMKRIYGAAYRIVVHNRFSYEEISQVLPAPSLAKVRVAPHGDYLDFVDPEPSRAEARRRLGLEADRPYLLFFGQIRKDKGLDVLLRAMPEVEEPVRLVVAGRPWKKDNWEDYRRIIDEHGLAERIVPIVRYVTDEERHLLFRACDGLALPYKHIYQSGVLLMAMSYALPVIASDLPSIRETVTHGENGFMFESQNPEDLARKVNEYFASEEFSESVKESALATIKRDFSWESIAQSYRRMLAGQ